MGDEIEGLKEGVALRIIQGGEPNGSVLGAPSTLNAGVRFSHKIYIVEVLSYFMPYKKIKLQELNLENRHKRLRQVSGTEYKFVLRFIEKAKVERDITDVTERKYLDALLMALQALGKSLSRVSRKDLERLKTGLTRGLVCSKNKRVYSDASQREMTLIVARYLEWRFPKRFSDLRKWFVVRTARKTPEILSEEEIEMLFRACQTLENRFLIAFLFDSGFRAGELLNIRFEDVIEPSSDFPYYRVDLKSEYSKTEGRIIGLYWKFSTKTIREYLSGCDMADPKKQVVSRSYDAIRMFISRLGRRVLNRRVHPHMFRKSSATYYAPKLNRQQLCYRFGWRFSSNVPDVYISRAGLKEEEVKQRILNTDLEKLQRENRVLEAKFALMRDSNERELSELRSQFEALRSGKGVMSLLMSLADKQKQMSEVLEKVSGKRIEIVLPSDLGKGKSRPAAN